MLRALALVYALGSVASADEALGTLHLDVSGNEAAQHAFRSGLLALHSFWFEEATDNFAEAARLDPTMPMAHWGAALAYYHPVWDAENVVGCRAELAKIDRKAALQPVEKAFIDAARTLCGDGDKDTRWRRYADALRDAHAKLPQEEEIEALEAASLLGVAYGVEHASRKRRAEAGALALDLFARNPDHPGAAHYIIHAFDDPEQAILALPAARRYAQIAPAAYHARHMPSHIFVQLGMWEEAAASNESSWAASVEMATKRGRDSSYYDFHSLDWLIKIRFELGQTKLAAQTLQRGLDAYARSEDPDRMPFILGGIADNFMVQTKSWARADELLAPLHDVAATMQRSKKLAAMPACPGHTEASIKDTTLEADLRWATGHAEAAAGLHHAAEARARMVEARAVLAKMTKKNADDWRGAIEEIEGTIAELEGHADELERVLRAALAEEKKSNEPPSGPGGVHTAREALGALLLRTKRAPEALALYREELEIRPRRSLSLLGAARAAKAAKDPAARTYYRALADLWKSADDSPELREVRREAK